MVSDLLKAVEYLDSFEEVEVVGVDSFGDRIVIGAVEYDFLIIAGTYVESNWGIRVVTSGLVAG